MRVAVGVAFAVAASGTGCTRSECDTSPPPLPLGSFQPVEAPTEALVAATITIEEGSVRVVYADETGATWTVVYQIDE